MKLINKIKQSRWYLKNQDKIYRYIGTAKDILFLIVIMSCMYLFLLLGAGL